MAAQRPVQVTLGHRRKKMGPIVSKQDDTDPFPVPQPGSVFEDGFSSESELLSSTVGPEFLRAFVVTLKDAVDVDMVAISELRIMEEERIHVLAGQMDETDLADFEYNACVTPCFEVIKGANPVVVHGNAQSAYPKDDFFQEQGIRSYAGVPLLSQHGEIAGLVQLAWRHETTDAETQPILDVIADYSKRLASELENLHATRILAALARGSEEPGSTGIFRLIAQQMQQAFKARTVFVAECSPVSDQHFNILAYCNGGTLVSELEGQAVPYEGTPCEHLASAQEFRLQTGLADAFPMQPHFRAEGLDSYLGVRIDDHSGKAIGHFAIQHDHPISTRKFETDLLRIFTDRFGSELRRRKTDQ